MTSSLTEDGKSAYLGQRIVRWLFRRARYADALRTIGTTCENFTGPPFCSDPRSGRTRGARYGADAWCHGCIARDALAPTSRAGMA